MTMTDMKNYPIGVQSFTLRRVKPFEAMLAAVKEAGLQQVELWPNHLLYGGVEPEYHRERLAALKDSGLDFSAYGAVPFAGDEADTRMAMEFIKDAGATYLTVDVDPEAWAITDKLAGEYGLKLAIHNHGKAHRYGKLEQVKKALDGTTENTGVCLDTAWCQEAGEDPMDWLDAVGGRVYGVHLKDFVMEADGSHRDVIIGEGSLDLPVLFQRLGELNFDGYISIEFEGNPDNPLPDLKACVEAVEKARQG